MKEQKELEFKIDLDEANVMLNALSKQPFEQVAKLINKLQEQAQEQLKEVKE
jgi:ribosome-associated toxin RatA of RatAB toxin-antitoxin module